MPVNECLCNEMVDRSHAVCAGHSMHGAENKPWHIACLAKADMLTGRYGAAFLILMGSVAARANPAVTSEEREDAHSSVTAGAGVIWLEGDEASGAEDAGGTLSLRGIFGGDSPLALDTTDRIDPQLLAPAQARIKGSGLQGALRLDLGELIVHPYVAVGGGWPGYWVYIDDELNVEAVDEALMVPAGAGLRFKAGRALVDVRASYMLTMEREPSPVVAMTGSFSAWSATIRADVTF